MALPNYIFKTTKIMRDLRVILVLSAILISSSYIFISCDKSPVSRSTVSLFLTDGPGNYDAVMIDIQKVEVKIDHDPESMMDDNHGLGDDDADDHLTRKDRFGDWTDINFNPGVFDVLSLRNGVETKLGEASIDKGTVRKIRITLGENNTVTLSGQTYPLLLKDDKNMVYVKLFGKHRQHDRNKDLKVWVDFDIANSIVEENGQFFLKPVLRPFCNENFGEVEGAVLPLEAKAVVRISDGNGFNAVALPNRDGRYKIRGLNEGTYNVSFEGIAPYINQAISNVVIYKGKTTKLEPVTLKK